jgi:hypothetical protein
VDSTKGGGRCERCGADGARIHLGEELLCDRCTDREIAKVTGMPELPDAPGAESITGPDGRAHRFSFRLWRAPTGIVAEAEEANLAAGEGYHLKVIGSHDADIPRLIEILRNRLERRLSHLWLEPHPRNEGWIIAGDRIEGRLEWNETGKPFDAVVDGRRLSWEELGRALEPFEGWRFTLSFEDTDDVDTSAESEAEVIELPRQDALAEADREDLLGDFDDEDEFLAAWDQAEADAVDLLRRALPELVDAKPPPGALTAAADSLRAGIRSGRWPYEHARRAAGFKTNVLPKSNLEVWLGAVGGLISMREESGLGAEEESTLMAAEHADWLGAIVGLVRAGEGASAEPEVLVAYVNSCPEVDGGIDQDEASLAETAFELVLPAWEAAGAVDSDRRLTALGRWGLARALAWAWNGDFDHPTETASEDRNR